MNYKLDHQEKHLHVMSSCAIWYHLYNLKKIKNTHRGGGGCYIYSNVADYGCITFLYRCFSRFLNCANGTKLLKAS